MSMAATKTIRNKVMIQDVSTCWNWNVWECGIHGNVTFRSFQEGISGGFKLDDSILPYVKNWKNKCMEYGEDGHV